MSDTLFRRSFRLNVGGTEFSSVDVQRPLAFSFSVARDKTINPNTAKILIYNLGETTRDRLAQQASQDGVTVRLEAGYGDNIGTLFFGVLLKVQSWRQGPTWHTEISGSDKQTKNKKKETDEEPSLLTAKISQTFSAGTPISDVVKALVTALGVEPGSLNNTLTALRVGGFLAGGDALPKAWTAHGDAATILEQVLKSAGFEWSIQDGLFLAGPKGQATLPGTGPELSPQTGLIGTPHLDKKGRVVGKALLYADLLPGRVFRVRWSQLSGDFICEKTVHQGQSDGDNWEVSFLGAPPAKESKLNP